MLISIILIFEKTIDNASPMCFNKVRMKTIKRTKAGIKRAKTIKERFGSDFYSKIGHKGGSTTANRYFGKHNDS